MAQWHCKSHCQWHILFYLGRGNLYRITVWGSLGPLWPSMPFRPHLMIDNFRPIKYIGKILIKGTGKKIPKFFIMFRFMKTPPRSQRPNLHKVKHFILTFIKFKVWQEFGWIESLFHFRVINTGYKLSLIK